MPTRVRAARTLRLGCLATAALLACGQPLQAQTGAEPPARARAAKAPAGHSPALKSRAPVTVNFVNADIEAVTRAMAAMIERQIVRRPARQGHDHGLQRAAADGARGLPQLPVGAARPGLHGGGERRAAEGGARGRRQAADRHACRSATSALRGDQIITQIFQLNHENPNNLVAVLRPLISANNTINANPGNNSLVITDYADNLQRIAKIIAALDQPAGSDIEVVPLKHAVASRPGADGAAPGRRRRRVAGRSRGCPRPAAR